MEGVTELVGGAVGVHPKDLHLHGPDDSLGNAVSLGSSHEAGIHGPLKSNPTLVTDNGSSFIARRFRNFTRDAYRYVRIAYRTPTQLGLLERFHRTFKSEEISWRLYVDLIVECVVGVFRDFLERFVAEHGGLNAQIASTVYGSICDVANLIVELRREVTVARLGIVATGAQVPIAPDAPWPWVTVHAIASPISRRERARIKPLR